MAQMKLMTVIVAGVAQLVHLHAKELRPRGGIQVQRPTLDLGDRVVKPFQRTKLLLNAYEIGGF